MKIKDSEIARHLGMSRQWLSDLKNGRIDSLKMDNTVRISAILGIKYTDLLLIPGPAIYTKITAVYLENVKHDTDRA